MQICDSFCQFRVLSRKQSGGANLAEIARHLDLYLVPIISQQVLPGVDVQRLRIICALTFLFCLLTTPQQQVVTREFYLTT
ncbi:MAG TPA: hypothetical protein IGS40_27835 [Trichormus sp. M33_DOE_039]|nr:hypothetical protein [Trichormus sp. M33_DOE_039]